MLTGEGRRRGERAQGQDGGDWHLIGSADLVHSLLDLDLVDEFRVIIDPVVVGGGKRLFSDDGRLWSLELLDSTVTSKGSIIAT